MEVLGVVVVGEPAHQAMVRDNSAPLSCLRKLPKIEDISHPGVGGIGEACRGLEDHFPERSEFDDGEVGKHQVPELNRLGGANRCVLLLAQDGNDGRGDVISGNHPAHYVAVVGGRGGGPGAPSEQVILEGGGRLLTCVLGRCVSNPRPTRAGEVKHRDLCRPCQHLRKRAYGGRGGVANGHLKILVEESPIAEVELGMGICVPIAGGCISANAKPFGDHRSSGAVEVLVSGPIQHDSMALIGDKWCRGGGGIPVHIRYWGFGVPSEVGGLGLEGSSAVEVDVVKAGGGANLHRLSHRVSPPSPFRPHRIGGVARGCVRCNGEGAGV